MMRKVLYILGQLSDEDVAWMARAGRRLDAATGTILIRQGEAVADMFFLLGGEAAVLVEGVGEVARLGRGEVVGEMSFVDRAPPSATVRAEAGCHVLALPKAAIEARLASEPGFAGRFWKALAIFLADRLRATNDRLRAKAGGSMKAGQVETDELDEGLLEDVSLAGLRFETLLGTLAGAGAGRG